MINAHSVSLRVCLIWVKTERMENRERKIGWKLIFFTVWLRVGGGEKSGGAHKFSLLHLQNTISPNWRENWSEKWEKYLNKTAPPFFMFLALFFFFLFFLWLFHCNVGFSFFLFSFFFLWFCQVVGSSSFPSFFFFFLIFLLFF